jgi:hypothetical protein
MESKYSCEICGTIPDQLSHNKSHLQTKKHKDNCETFVTEMAIFSIAFRKIDPRKWYETEYKDYIISKYITDKKVDILEGDIINDVGLVNDITKWLIYEIKNSHFSEKYDWNPKCFNGKSPQDCYENENNCKIDTDIANAEFKNWAINRILKFKEMTQIKPTRHARIISKSDNHYKLMLSRHINIKFNKIKDIRNGLIDLRYLSKPKCLLTNNEDIEIYNDDAVRYSCLLFQKFGIHSLYCLYNGLAGPIDIEEHPEEKKNNSFYFFKEIDIEHTSKISDVINYGETRIERKKIWVSCYMGDFIDNLDDINNASMNYSYISSEDFKYFIKESLIEVFSNIVKMIENKIDYTKNEIFNSQWKNPEDKIICDFKTNVGYLINKKNDVFWRNEIMYVYDKITEEEREIKLEQKITEEQVQEYLLFKHKNYEMIENLTKELKYCEDEILNIKELSLSSDTIKSVIQICQYLFEYNVDLIEYYKNHMCVEEANEEKEFMEKEFIDKL